MTRFEPVAQFRSRIASFPGGIVASIPGRRNYFFAAFLAFWLCMWAVGLVTVAGSLLHPTKNTPVLFMVAWLGGWLVGGGFAIATLLWLLDGQERITLASRSFSIRREAFALGLTRHYDLREVSNLRVVDGGISDWLFTRVDPFALLKGPLAFDYGAKTVKFGAGIDVAEARQLLAKLLAAKPALSNSQD